MHALAVAVALIVPLAAGAARGETPIAASRFSISIDGVQIATFAEADVNLAAKPPTVVLKQGRASSGKLDEWHAAAGDSRSAAARKPAVLVEHDARGKPVRRYQLEQAWPSKLQRGGGAVPMETVTLTCERIVRVSH